MDAKNRAGMKFCGICLDIWMIFVCLSTSLVGNYLVINIRGFAKQFSIPEHSRQSLLWPGRLIHLATLVSLCVFSRRLFEGKLLFRWRWLALGMASLGVGFLLFGLTNFLFTPPENIDLELVNEWAKPPEHILRDDYEPLDVINYPPVRKKLPDNIREYILQQIALEKESGDTTKPNNGADNNDFLEGLFGRRRKRSTKETKKRKPKSQMELGTMAFMMTMGWEEYRNFIDELRFSLINKDPTLLGQLKRVSLMEFGFCNPLVNEMKPKAFDIVCNPKFMHIGAFATAAIALILIHFGSALPWVLVTSYFAQKLTSYRSRSFMLSLLVFVHFLGSLLGFIFGFGFFQLKNDLMKLKQGGPKPGYPSWIGAWWLGAFVLGAIFLVSAIVQVVITFKKKNRSPIIRLPTMPKQRVSLKKSDECNGKEENLLKKANKEKSFAATMFANLFGKKFWISLSIVFSMSLAYLSVKMFLPDYLIQNFGQTKKYAYLTRALLPTICLLVGILIGIFAQLIIPVKLRRRILILMAFLFILVGVLAFVPIIFKCKSQWSLLISNMGNEKSVLNASCSSGCDCDDYLMNPACTRDGKQIFFSPCHAGCEDMALNWHTSQLNFSKCSCVEAKEKVLNSNWCTKTENWHEDCSLELKVYWLLLFFTFALAGVSLGPLLVSALQLMPKEFHIIFLSALAFISNFNDLFLVKLTAGKIMDSTCFHWKRLCDHDQCAIYSIDQFGTRLHTFFGLLALLIAAFLGLAHKYFAKQNEDESIEDEQIKM